MPFCFLALLVNTLLYLWYIVIILYPSLLAYFFPYVLYSEIYVCSSGSMYTCQDVLISQTTWWKSGVNPSALVDSSTFRHDNELVLFEDLIINPSTYGLNNKLVHLWT